MHEWWYKKQRGYLVYAEGDGEDRRIDGMMPPLQMNNQGQVILVPGEVYCRWRGTNGRNGRLCTKKTRYNQERSLHRHYRVAHKVESEPRTLRGFTYAYHLELTEWYKEVMLGNQPHWIPRKPHGTAPPATTKSDDSLTTVSEWPTPKQGSPAPEQESPASEQESPAPEQQSPAPEQESPAPEQESPAPKQQSPAPEQQSPAPRQQSPAPRQQSPAPRQQSPAPGQQSPAPEKQSP